MSQVRTFIFILTAVLLSGCGVSSHTVSPETGAVSFITEKALELKVTVDDNEEYTIRSVRTDRYNAKKSIKESAKNTVRLSSGKHTVKVECEDDILYSEELYTTTSGHIIIKL